MLNSGLFLGYTSSSSESKSSAGAKGNCPRIAWLPTTTSSLSSTMALQARMTCSSSERFIASEDLVALLNCQNAGERAGLAKLIGAFALFSQEPKQFLKGPCFNHCFPGLQNRQGSVSRVFHPAGQIPSGNIQKLWVAMNFFRYDSMQGKTAFVYPVVPARNGTF